MAAVGDFAFIVIIIVVVITSNCLLPIVAVFCHHFPFVTVSHCHHHIPVDGGIFCWHNLSLNVNITIFLGGSGWCVCVVHVLLQGGRRLGHGVGGRGGAVGAVNIFGSVMKVEQGLAKLVDSIKGDG